MAEVRYNNSSGQLGAPMAPTDTAITFNGSPGWATLVGGDYIKLEIDPTLGSDASPNPLFEIVYVSAYTAGASTATIERGQEGTTAQAHAINAIWFNGPTAADYASSVDVTDGTTFVGATEIYFTQGATVTVGGSGVADVAITGAPPTGAAGGVLSGTYPNPGLSTSAEAIPNGWTATTQAALDDSTKVSTTAYADAAVGVEKTRAEAAEALLAPLVQRVNTVATSGAAQTIPAVSTATISNITLSANCTLTFPAAAAGEAFLLQGVQPASGGPFSFTWPGSGIVWLAGTAPTQATGASKRDLYSFTCIDGTHWVGEQISPSGGY